MKKIKLSLKIFLTIFLILITTSFIAENIVIKTVTSNIIAKKVSGYLLDKIVYDVDIDELGKIENNIRKSNITEQITAKFIDVAIKNIVNNQIENFEIENEINELVKKYMPENMSEEKLQTIRDYATKNITNMEKRMQNDLVDGFGTYYTAILKIYSIFTNLYFRIILFILIIVCIISLYFMEKIKLIKTMRIICFILAIYMIIIFMVISLLSKIIDQTLAGGRLQQIDCNSVIFLIAITLAIGILLFIVEKIKKENIIKKAGCILINLSKKEIALICKNGEYSFPKGHLEKNETLVECAIRETKEETGHDCHLVSEKELSKIHYNNSKGENVETCFYLAIDDGITNDIIDEKDKEETKWIKYSDVEHTLSYQNLKDFWNENKIEVKRIIDKN